MMTEHDFILYGSYSSEKYNFCDDLHNFMVGTKLMFDMRPFTKVILQ